MIRSFTHKAFKFFYPLVPSASPSPGCATQLYSVALKCHGHLSRQHAGCSRQASHLSPCSLLRRDVRHTCPPRRWDCARPRGRAPRCVRTRCVHGDGSRDPPPLLRACRACPGRAGLCAIPGAPYLLLIVLEARRRCGDAGSTLTLARAHQQGVAGARTLATPRLGLQSLRAVASRTDADQANAPTAMDWDTLTDHQWGSVETDFMTIAKHGPEVS